MNTPQKKPYTSTRKNPDKYIQKLKDEIDRLERVSQYEYQHLRAEIGKHQFSYNSEHYANTVFASPKAVPELFPGSRVKLEAEVVSVRRDTDETRISVILKNCFRLGD